MDKSSLDYAAMGRRIRERRIALHLTQEALAEMAQVSTSFIGHLERAEKIPSLETVARLCNKLGMTADYLVFGRETRCDGNCTLYAELLAILRAHG